MKARLVRPLLNFVASVAMVSGGLLLVEATITVLWQEPLSALVASRAQASLSSDVDDLAEAARLDREQVDDLRKTPREIARQLAQRQTKRLESGEAIGRIEMPAIDASFVMVEGSGTAPLRKGPGHYEGTPLPGMHGTFAVAGHRTTYLAPFRRIDELEEGDPIKIEMPYGDFTYHVEGTRIVDPDDVWVKNDTAHDRLVLTACHPLYSAQQRIVAFADLQRFRLKGSGADA